MNENTVICVWNAARRDLAVCAVHTLVRFPVFVVIRHPPIPPDEQARLEEQLEEQKRNLSPEELESMNLQIPKDPPVGPALL